MKKLTKEKKRLFFNVESSSMAVMGESCTIKKSTFINVAPNLV
jgi:hypothetical protein